MEKFSVSVVIFATDESNSLLKTVDYLNSCCRNTPQKIIIVLSKTASVECVNSAELLKVRYNNIEVTIQKQDGFGRAVVHGINCVKTSHLILFPADLAIELESIDRMIDAAKNDPVAIIKTSRWLRKGDFVGYNKIRLFFNWVAQRFLRVLFSSELTDLTNPVQLISTEVELSINWQEKGFSVLVEQTVVPVRLGFSIKEVPAKCYPRLEGNSKNSTIKTIMYLKTVLRIRFTSKKKLYKSGRLIQQTSNRF